MKEPTQKQIKACIAFFKSKDIKAYSYGKNVVISLDFPDELDIEISDSEIIERAEIYNGWEE